jgi:hypothetical protein
MATRRPASLPELARFGSPLARVMFVEPDVPGAVRASPSQMRLARWLAGRISTASDKELHTLSRTIDSDVLKCLSSDAMIEIAIAIEKRAPWMLENMPALAAHRKRLSRACEMAAAFSPEHLARLGEALRKEASRA